jgi:hypothetical protein
MLTQKERTEFMAKILKMAEEDPQKLLVIAFENLNETTEALGKSEAALAKAEKTVEWLIAQLASGTCAEPDSDCIQNCSPDCENHWHARAEKAVSQ